MDPIADVLAVSNGAKWLARALGSYSVAVVDSQSGQSLVVVRHPEVVRLAAFSPDHRTLATCCGDHTVCLWNVASGQEVARLATRPGEFIKLQSSSDGRRLAVALRTDQKYTGIEHTYSDGRRYIRREDATMVVTIWSGSDEP
jgi:WD40 repeat protein